MSNYFDRQGNPIGQAVWAERFEDREYRHVARDEVGDFEVSTVWVGDDRDKDGTPLIFESVVLGLDGGEIRTYATEDEARAGHAEYVAWLKGEGPDPTSTFADRATRATDEAMRLIRSAVPGARIMVVLEGMDRDDNHLGFGNPREDDEWTTDEIGEALHAAGRAITRQPVDSRYGW